MSITSKSFLPVFLILAFSFPAIAGELADMRLEGVVLDESAPENSVAILNGEFIKTGQKAGHYQVLEIAPQSVYLLDEQTGEKHWVETSGRKVEPVPEAAENEAAPRTVNAGGLQEKIKELAQGPARLINRVVEMKALRDLTLVNNACVVYYEKKKNFPREIKELTDANLLAKSYESGSRGEYHFSLIKPANPEDFAIKADPVRNEGLRHFYVGTDAVIRESSGQPANATSSPHDY